MPIYDVDPYGNEIASTGISPPVPPMVADRNDAAKRSARMRLLAALAGGLSAPNQGGGFFGGLASGFAGSIGAGMGYDQKRHEQQRQEERDAADRRRLEIENERLGLERQRVGYEGQRLNRPEKSDTTGNVKDYQFLIANGVPPQEAIRRVFGKDSQGRAETDAEFFRRDPEGFLKYKQAGRADEGAEDLGTVTDVTEQDEFGYPIRTVRRKITSKTPDAFRILGGEKKKKPLSEILGR